MQIKFPTVEEVKKDEVFVDKVIQFRGPLLVGAFLFVLGAALFSTFEPKKMARERDFFTLSSLFQKLSSPTDELDQEKLMTLLKKYPEVSPQFDHLLRDKMILEGDKVKKGEIEERVLSRLSYADPFFLEYMKISRLIDAKEWAVANERIIALKEKIEEVGIDHYPRLYGCLVSRYSFLQKQLGNAEEAKKAGQYLRELMMGDSELLGKKGKLDAQKYVAGDKLISSMFFDNKTS